MRRSFLIAALAWAAFVSVALLIVPVYAGMETSFGSRSAHPVRSTLVEGNGARAGLVILVPVLLAVIPLVVHDRYRGFTAGVAGSVLAILSLVAAMSLGLFYAPAALLLLIAAFIPGHRSKRESVASVL